MEAYGSYMMNIVQLHYIASIDLALYIAVPP